MVRLENVSYGYDRHHKVFTDMSLSFGEGHIHGLLGCNGVGKSTMLKLICGLLHPQGGVVEVDGLSPQKRSVKLLSELIIIPEEIGLPAVTLNRYAAVTAPFYPLFSQQNFNTYCAEFGIDPTVKFHKLSMGQRKKAYIAFALACNVRTLLLDEPTNGLDIPSKSVFRRLLAAYINEQRTVIISTHQVNDVENLIDNVVICDMQGVVLNASTERITRKLAFGMTEAGAVALYSEPSLTGVSVVRANTSNEETPLNLEMLFKATVTSREQIIHIMNE